VPDLCTSSRDSILRLWILSATNSPSPSRVLHGVFAFAETFIITCFTLDSREQPVCPDTPVVPKLSSLGPASLSQTPGFGGAQGPAFLLHSQGLLLLPWGLPFQNSLRCQMLLVTWRKGKRRGRIQVLSVRTGPSPGSLPGFQALLRWVWCEKTSAVFTSSASNSPAQLPPAWVPLRTTQGGTYLFGFCNISP
jgi:hypothetical protein